MSLNRYAKRRDENEPDIIARIRSHGVSVYLLDKPCDVLCGFNGLDRIAEIKMPRNKRGDPSKLTPAQVKFKAVWKGSYTVISNDDEADAFALKLQADSRLVARAV